MSNRVRRLGVVILVLAGALGTAAAATAQTDAGAHAVAPLAEQYCFRCHGPQTQTAGIDLATLVTERPLVRNRETWERVIEALDEGEMPPAGAPPLPPEVRRRMAALLHRDIEEFDYSTLDDPGFELMRRLTHTEYDNTVRDLFGVALNVTDRFPDELTGSSGFDNSSNTLFLQPALMERYIAAAERVVELALPAEPTDVRHLASRELVFVAAPGDGLSEEDAAEAVLERFLGRAYRRPAAADEVDQAVERYRIGRTAGLDHEVAVKRVLQSVLISPKFLLRVERGHAGADPYRVDDWELASRLSYFLWASMPDQELFDLAARGELRDPETLRAQVTRMLADRRADTLGTVFAAQWLGFQHVGTRIWLDPIDNPWCTATLMTAMRDESSLFFLSLLRENRPVRSLIDADYTYVNEELAGTLYGMADVRGEHMRRVALDDPNRGGVLGQPSILAPHLELQGHEPRQARQLRARRAARHAAPAPRRRTPACSARRWPTCAGSASARSSRCTRATRPARRATAASTPSASASRTSTTSGAGARPTTSASGSRTPRRRTRPSSSRPRPAPTPSSGTTGTPTESSPPTGRCPTERRSSAPPG